MSTMMGEWGRESNCRLPRLIALWKMTLMVSLIANCFRLIASGWLPTTDCGFWGESSRIDTTIKYDAFTSLELKILRKQWQCNRIAMARWPFETSQKEQWFQEARRLGKFKFPKFLREKKCEAHTLLSSRNSYAGQTLLFNSHVVIIRGILK